MKHHAIQRDYWRSLEHLAQSDEVRAQAGQEFESYDPQGMLGMPPLTRRRFMKLMSASMALAGLTLTGCRRYPEEKLAPYTSNPKNRVPGMPEKYATIMEVGGVASPLLVTSFDGRPIKIEGNPTHPFSMRYNGNSGASDAIAQASILELYDPDRSVAIRKNGGTDALDWESFVKAFGPQLAGHVARQGEGLAVLSESTSSPTTQRLKAKLQTKLPLLTWYEYEPISRFNEIVGSRLALQTPARQVLHLDKADVAVFFDADPLGSHPAHLKYAGDWATRRRSADDGDISRVYVVESAFTITGSVADVRLPIKPSRVIIVLGAVAAKLGAGNTGIDEKLTADEMKFVERASADLAAAGSKGVVAIASHFAPELQALALAINSTIGAIGNTVTLHEEPNADRPNDFDAISLLAKDIKAQKIQTLVILGGNPVYDAPADVEFASLLGKVPTQVGGITADAILSVHLSLYANETSKACAWHIPRAHYLESWGDGRAWDGTISVCQPLIEPLYDGKTVDQMISFLNDGMMPTADAAVRDTFATLLNLDPKASAGDFEQAYRKILEDGLIRESAFKTVTAPVRVAEFHPPAAVEGFEIRFVPDMRVYDGRFAGSGWLQEMPEPLTKLVWDNAAFIAKKDADALGVEGGDMLKIDLDGRSLDIAAYILPGQPVGVITLPLGYGRTEAGHIGSGLGFNAYSIRSTKAPFAASGAHAAKGNGSYVLATTQNQQLLDDIGASGRDERIGEKHKSAEIIQEATFDEYKKDPEIFHRNEDGTIGLELFDPPRVFNDPHAWGMAIDLSTCIGCQACVIACQAENNVPIVGKDQVLKNRQMHWIRIDRYFKSDANDPAPDVNPEVVYQPMTCQQCENAPCEQVCPVGATMHDTEGLNVMVYNRCVGTRYCSNNCPYKVRRFNYLDFNAQDPRHDKYPAPWLGIPDQQQISDEVNKMKRMVFNPDVTVRMRGVMEKCSYCVQRIHQTKINKRIERGTDEILDGEIITACQQACPTQAIVFGDLKDPNSRVSLLHKNNRAYKLLDKDLNTRPRNRYLAKISNPVIA